MRRLAAALAAALVLATHTPARAHPPALALDFVVHDGSLVQAACAGRYQGAARPDEDAAMLALQNRAWAIDRAAYDRLRARDAHDLIHPDGNTARDPGVARFVAAVLATPEFARVRRQAEGRRRFCEAQWRAGRARSEAFVRRLTGLTASGRYTVYVYHPALAMGRNMGHHQIQWGGREDWPHYTTVYMWHEILHDHLPKTDLGHVLVQLVADRELRAYLDPQADRERYEGHGYLETLTRTVLPAWRVYLRRPRPSLMDLHAELASQGL